MWTQTRRAEPVILTVVIGLHGLALLGLLFSADRIELKVSESKPILANIIAPSRPSPVITPAVSQARAPAQERPKSIVRVPKPTPVGSVSPESAKPEEPAPKVEQRLDAKPRLSQDPAASEVIQPKFDADYLNNPKPAYPSISRRLGEEGVVLLRVYVNAMGQPERIEVNKSSGFERLDAAALRAVSDWKFVPARQGKISVAAWVQVPVSFQLRR